MRVVAKGSGRKCGDGTSVGLFIPLPLWIARKFPTLIPDDNSPSHVTLLYIGEVTDPEEQARLVEVLRKTCGRFYWNSARATLGEVSSFDHGERVVPHIQVEFSRDFASFRRLIRQELTQEGFKPEDKYVEYKPHVTLDYLDPDEEWGGKTPKGSWTFNKIEVWGLPDQVPKLQLGKVKIAYDRQDMVRSLSSGAGVRDRLQGLMRRLALLEKRAQIPPVVKIYLPIGADFIWNSTEDLIQGLKTLDDPAAARQKTEIKSLLQRILSLMHSRARFLETLKNQQMMEYYQEIADAVDKLDGLYSIIGDLQVHETTPQRSLLQRMRSNVYPRH